MSKTLSAKYYQGSKERLKKAPRERYKNLSKEEKEKKQQYGRIIIEKYYRIRKKMPFYNYKKHLF